MEFYARLRGGMSAADLQHRLQIPALTDWCSAIDRILHHEGDRGSLYCLWGEFEVLRTPINGGVRFALLNCANALAWTITTDLPPDPDEITVHLTINRPEHDPDFIESIEYFVAEWKRGIEERQGGGAEVA